MHVDVIPFIPHKHINKFIQLFNLYRTIRSAIRGRLLHRDTVARPRHTFNHYSQQPLLTAPSLIHLPQPLSLHAVR